VFNDHWILFYRVGLYSPEITSSLKRRWTKLVTCSQRYVTKYTSMCSHCRLRLTASRSIEFSTYCLNDPQHFYRDVVKANLFWVLWNKFSRFCCYQFWKQQPTISIFITRKSRHGCPHFLNKLTVQVNCTTVVIYWRHNCKEESEFLIIQGYIVCRILPVQKNIIGSPIFGR
jgi:hypothetical protein